MYSDLFDHLGSSSTSGGGPSSGSRDNDKNLLTFKAGKMEMTMQENGKYWVTPDTRRGEIRITWKTNENALYWEWYDRREKMVADRYILQPSASSTGEGCGTLEKVVDCVKEPDRIILWTRTRPSGGSSSGSSGSSNVDYHMYWLQDASDEKDDEIIVEVNQFLADPASANPSGATSAADDSGRAGARGEGRGGASGRGRSEGSSAASTSSERQVDALSNILENLGMPHSAESSQTPSTTSNNNATGAAARSTATAGAAASASAAGGTGTLTLADLQGAMAGLRQQQTSAVTSSTSGPPLQELVTPAAITSLLENENVSKRLLELLPESQRSMEYLEENLRSPQVQQTLRSLTSALLPDDSGSYEGFHSVLANFSLGDGNEALTKSQGNPIQAFLDCVLKSVQKDKKDDKDDTKMDEGKDEEQKE